MKKSFLGIAALVIVIFNACNNEPKLMEVSALEGNWYEAKMNMHEGWNSVGQNHLKGQGFEINDSDTTVFEKLEIKESNGVLTYFADVEDVMGQGIISFPLSNHTVSSIEFTNKEHDYPQVLLYEKQGTDSLKVTIGKFPLKDDKEPVVFNFVRKK